MSEAAFDCDVAIIGGGPAGLAAAAALRRAGIEDIVVLEREGEAGGVPRHCGHYPFGLREFRRLLRGPDYAKRNRQAAIASGAILREGVTVLSLSEGPAVTISDESGTRQMRPRRVLLATGAREASRAARFIGGGKPGGVLSTGALQGLVYLGQTRPFRHPVILGTELVAFSAILTCRHLGIRPAAMIEPSDRVSAFRAAALLPKMLGIPLHRRTEILSIEGTRHVEAVRLRGPDGEERRLETDGVIVSGQFLPDASLLADSHLERDRASGGPVVDEDGRCSDPHFYAAGNLLRAVETAGWSWREGKEAGKRIAADLQGSARKGARERPIHVDVAGPPLKYVVPQRLRTVGDRSGHFQLRVLRPVKGRLQLLAGGEPIWSRRIASSAQKRILVPFSALSDHRGGDVSFRITEE